MLKDLTLKRTRYIAHANRLKNIGYLLTRLVKTPDGRTYYKFMEHDELVEAVKQYVIRNEIQYFIFNFNIGCL